MLTGSGVESVPSAMYWIGVNRGVPGGGGPVVGGLVGGGGPG